MRIHHTKNKGDLGLLKAQCDLAEKGYMILIPLTEHSAFDLVGYKDEKFTRFQVKYRSVNENGVLAISMKSYWAISMEHMPLMSINLLLMFTAFIVLIRMLVIILIRK